MKAETYFKYAVDKEREMAAVDIRASYHLHNNMAVFYYKKAEYRKSIMEYELVMEWVEREDRPFFDNK